MEALFHVSIVYDIGCAPRASAAICTQCVLGRNPDTGLRHLRASFEGYRTKSVSASEVSTQVGTSFSSV